jgi:hypothetical protein
MACKSFIGFQSCSTKITVLALVSVNPSPPTCHEKKAINAIMAQKTILIFGHFGKIGLP